MIFLPARRCASADTSYGPASQVGVLSKRLNESGWFLPRELPNTYPTVCYQKFMYSVPVNLLSYHGLYLIIFVLLLAILYNHMIMHVGLFGHSAVVFRVFMFY